MQPPTAAVPASSLECLSSCRSSWKVGGGGGRPYECSVLSCAWNAPRALTGALASTTQCSSCSHAEGLGGGRRRGRPRQSNTLVHITWAEDINKGRLGHGSSASFVSSGEKFRSWSIPVKPTWRVSCHSSSDPFNLVSPETLWESLRPAISYLQPEELNFVHDALKLAYEAHNGQKRRSGEPFIIHPVEVARILGEHELDWESIAAGLLHDTVEDTDMVTFETIQNEFGATVRRIVEGETKVSKLGKLQCKNEGSSKQDVKAEDLRQMFLAMTEEVRVIIVKLADRLHNMRTLTHMPPHKQYAIAMETLQVFAPLAKLLGMYQIKVKKKLMNLGHAQSEETKIKISLGVRRGWSLRLQKLMVQDGCFVEWRDIIADAARKGFAGGVPFQWNSHKILTEHLRQEWLEKLQKRRSMPRPTGNRRAPKTPEQRRKIAEAIAAKWLDQEYRERVCSAINSYHGTSAGSKVPRKPRTPRGPGAKSEAVKRKPLKNRAVTLENSHVKNATIKRKKSTTPYKDPMAGEKLEMITKIRAQRTSLEIEKKEAIKRARSLIVEAEKAADALETVAATNPFAQASLIEARKLVTEARISLECVDDDEGHAESSSDGTSDESGISELHEYNLEKDNDLIKQESKPVNGMKLPPSNVNGMDFYFDVSGLGETEQLSVYQRIENSMERAYLLPSASSTTQDVNGELGANDLYVSQSLANNDQIDQIAAETTDVSAAEPPEDVSSPGSKSKMRWVRGRLVEVEE